MHVQVITITVKSDADPAELMALADQFAHEVAAMTGGEATATKSVSWPVEATS